jgi:hypothetical protein
MPPQYPTLIEIPNHSETQIPQIKKIHAPVSKKINQIVIERSKFGEESETVFCGVSPERRSKMGCRME